MLLKCSNMTLGPKIRSTWRKLLSEMRDPSITEADSEYKLSGILQIKVQSGTGVEVEPTQVWMIFFFP